MQRLIYDLEAKEAVAIIDPCDGTATGTPHFVFEGTAEQVQAKIAELERSNQPVPESVTAWQIRRWLLSQGILLSQVDAAIAAIPDAAQREAARVDWEYAPYVERSHPMLPLMAAALGIADLDAAFAEAAQIG